MEQLRTVPKLTPFHMQDIELIWPWMKGDYRFETENMLMVFC